MQLQGAKNIWCLVKITQHCMKILNVYYSMNQLNYAYEWPVVFSLLIIFSFTVLFNVRHDSPVCLKKRVGASDMVTPN